MSRLRGAEGIAGAPSELGPPLLLTTTHARTPDCGITIRVLRFWRFTTFYSLPSTPSPPLCVHFSLPFIP